MRSEMFAVLRFAAVLFVLAALIIMVSGCATTVTTKETRADGTACSVTTKGWFFAHYWSPSGSCTAGE